MLSPLDRCEPGLARVEVLSGVGVTSFSPASAWSEKSPTTANRTLALDIHAIGLNAPYIRSDSSARGLQSRSGLTGGRETALANAQEEESEA